MAMLHGNSKSTSRRAASAIIQARSRSSPTMRKFKVLPINMKAQHIKDFINWKDKREIYEPPWTMKFPDEDILAQVDNPNHIQVPHAPFHTQSVERHVKLVTEVSSRVSGFTNHHFEILNTVHSRRQMPKFDSKKMFPLKNIAP